MTDSVTVRIPGVVPWVLRIGGLAAGLTLGLLVEPLVQWIISAIGDAPGPLRLAAAMPDAIAFPVLAALGLAAGIWLATTARREALELVVAPDGVRLLQDRARRYLPRERIDAVFLDRSDLVLLDADTREIARNSASDLPKREVQEAFERLGYPWAGQSDPHEGQFRSWTDGEPALDEAAHTLLRSRARALADKRLGSAADLAEALQAAGVVVRDRDGAQQYRILPSPPPADAGPGRD